jgi:CopA family copper-resistance protein
MVFTLENNTNQMKNNRILIGLFILISSLCQGQVGTNGNNRNEEGRPIKEINLTIEKNKMTLGGVTAKAMSINGSIPGPILEFTEGDLAVINVTNNMDVETSIHWHGLILPNFQDGVPYLTTPPIKPGATFQYRIPLNQSGTYWYHSHTMLHEQKGVYGSIVIQPKEQAIDYDKELVVVISDWTNEKPMNVLKNLKRGNEWYQIKKRTAVPLASAIAQKGLGAQMKMWRDRMEGADIADIYYPTFLSNGEKTATYPDFKPGEKVRLRFINASASSYYWLDFGGGDPMIVSSDGVDVEPVHKSRLLFAIAETYDFVVTIPEGKLEIIATAQDGSGHTTIQLGEGDLFPAEVIGRPNKVEMMKQMAEMDMKMGAPAMIGNKKKNTPKVLMDKYGMKMGDNHMQMDHGNMNSEMEMSPKSDSMVMQNDADVSFDYTARKMYFNYDFLKAKEPTTFDADLPVTEMLLNLTGNMNRYVWSLNGIPLTEADKISIKQGEVTQITLNNLTMMHHPMHLHGHYFRVINKNGERSPLKHTVNVPPMEKVIIEFYNEEEGDWFFHCHVLYHMMGGMARVFSYNTPRDERMEDFPVKNLIKETDTYFFWGLAKIGTNFSEFKFTTSNIRNEIDLKIEFDYSKNGEAEFSYNRYLNDWVRVYAAVNTENESENSFDELNTVGLAGIKYFTPYMFYVDLNVDNQLRPRIQISKEFLLFSRLFIEGEYKYRSDFGWVNQLNNNEQYRGESEWLIGASFMLSRNFSIQGNYNNRYGWGGGLTIRF